MIEYTDKLPPVLYAVSRDRIRRGDGLRILQTSNLAWAYTTVGNERKPWALCIGRTCFQLSALYENESEAREAMRKLVREEVAIENYRFVTLIQKMNKSLET